MVLTLSFYLPKNSKMSIVLNIMVLKLKLNYLATLYNNYYRNSRKLQRKKISEAKWLPKLKYPNIIN